MIDSEVKIYNLALNAVGARDNISAPSENSREAEVCKLWYSVVRDQVLASAPWPEATKLEYLALLSEQDDDVWTAIEPAPGHQYIFSLPADCLRPQYLSDFSRFLITSYPDSRRGLSCGSPTPILHYTSRLEAIQLWSSELHMAVAYGLAAHICMPLSGKASRARSLAEQANGLMIAARVSAANASDNRFEGLPDWITARGYTGSISPYLYVYPVGSLLSPVTTSD